MRHKIIDIYTFGELSGKAKEKAKYDYQAQMGFPHDDEYMASLRALAKHFGGKLDDWSIDYFNCSHSTAKFKMPSPEDLCDESYKQDWEIKEHYEQWLKDKLLALGNCNPLTLRGLGDCKLTGYCADEDAIDGFRIAFMAGERDLDKLMQAAFRSWLKAAQNDCEGFYEDVYFEEHCDANGYEFLEDGSPA